MSDNNSDLSEFSKHLSVSTGTARCTLHEDNWVEVGAIDQSAGQPIPNLPYKIFDISTKEELVSGVLDAEGKSPQHEIPLPNTQLFVVFGTDAAIKEAMEQIETLQTQQALQANAVSEWRGISAGLDEQGFNQAYDRIAVENGRYEKPSASFFEAAAYGTNMLYDYVASGFDSNHMFNELYKDDRHRNFEEYQLATNARQATDGESFFGGAGQGLTFGFGEEIMAGLGSLLSDRPYEELVEERRQLQRAQQTANPNWYIGGEIAGAIPTIFIPVGGAAAAGARGAATTSRAVIQGSKSALPAGILFGGISGAGHDEGSIIERLDGTAMGAITGGVSAAVLGGAGVLIARGVSKTRIWARTKGRVASNKPEWLRRLDEGNKFNSAQNSNYPYNEVYINKPGGGSSYYRLDSYNPEAREIVSRKFSQFSEIQEQTALNYINELPNKYPAGATIANVPSNGRLAGQQLQGQLILEVPVQTNSIPKTIIDAAENAGVLIRDINGRIY